MSLRNINYPLLLGGLIVLFLIIVSFYPQLFTSNDPLYETGPKPIEYEKDGEIIEEFAYNPMRPNSENPLGTDDAGRDIYSRLIYGTRNTLKLVFLIAVFRMLIALPLGLAAGMGIKFISEIIKVLNTFFTAIPMLILSYIILNMDYFKGLEMDKAIIAYTIVLTIIGWSKLAGVIEDNVRRVMNEDFIEGELAIGKTKFQIAYQNVIPHIIPSSLSLFFKEMAMALFLIAQLAVLYVFVGVTRRVKTLSFRANYDMILEPEWGGSLSRITENIGKFETAYWMTLYPVLAFSIGIIGLNLLGEGLRIEFTKRNSRVISMIKKASYHLSPKLFIEQIKGVRKNYKPVLIKSFLIIIIISYYTIQWYPSTYEFDVDTAMTHIDELSHDKYMGRLTGSKGGYDSGDYIIDSLESYGYEVDISEFPLTESIIPLGMDEEISVPKDLAPVFIENGEVILTDKNNEEKTFYLHKDFTIASVDRNLFLDQGREEVVFEGIAATYDYTGHISQGDEFFPINSDSYYLYILDLPQPNIAAVASGDNLEYHTRFFFNEEAVDKHLVPYVFRSTIIVPFEELSNELASGYWDVKIRYDYPQLPEYPGRNISAFLPGKDKTKEDPGEIIIIGSDYDGVYQGDNNCSVMSPSAAATNLELARILMDIEEPLDKSVQFIFWDNESEIHKSPDLNGSAFLNREQQETIRMALNHGYYYIDLNLPDLKENDQLEFMVLAAQRIDSNSYLIGLDMEKRLNQLDVNYKRHHYFDYSSSALWELRLNAAATIGIGNPAPRLINTSLDNLENLNLEKLGSLGQIVVDTLTMEPRIME